MCLVDGILDSRCYLCAVNHDDEPPLVMVNSVGLPLVTILTSLNFSCLHFKMET